MTALFSSLLSPPLLPLLSSPPSRFIQLPRFPSHLHSPRFYVAPALFSFTTALPEGDVKSSRSVFTRRATREMANDLVVASRLSGRESQIARKEKRKPREAAGGGVKRDTPERRMCAATDEGNRAFRWVAGHNFRSLRERPYFAKTMCPGYRNPGCNRPRKHGGDYCTAR